MNRLFMNLEMAEVIRVRESAEKMVTQFTVGLVRPSSVESITSTAIRT
jgi:hypothetical protein